MATTRTNTKTAAQPTPVTPIKRTARGTGAKAPGLDQQHTANVDEEFSYETYMARLRAQFKITWTRERVVGMVLGLCVSFATGYILGAVLYAVTLAVFAGTASMFLALLIYALGLVLVAWAGGKLGSAVYEYVGTGAAREHGARAVGWVRGLFSRSDDAALA